MTGGEFGNVTVLPLPLRRALDLVRRGDEESGLEAAADTLLFLAATVSAEVRGVCPSPPLAVREFLLSPTPSRAEAALAAGLDALCGSDPIARWVRPAADLSISCPSERLDEILVALASGPPSFVAAFGRWAVRLDTGSEEDANPATVPVYVVSGNRRLALPSFVAYDPDRDDVTIEAAADGAPSSLPSPVAAGAVATNGTPFGPFRILRTIASGGQGVLSEAWQDPPGRHVALKTLPSHRIDCQEARARLAEEAAALARVDHEHVVRVYQAGEIGGVPFLAMKLVDGVSLSDVLRKLGPGPRRIDPIEWRRAVAVGRDAREMQGPHLMAVAAIGRDVATALEACHAKGVIHRDVKPGNILIDRSGRVLLADFGLARTVGGRSLTKTGTLLGTLAYTAPEAIRPPRGRRPDRRVDVYGLGATLFELATLRRPFAEEEGGEGRLMAAVVEGAPRSVRATAPWVPRDLAVVIEKAMAREPECRYASAMDLADDLARFLAGQPVRARPQPIRRRVAAWARRHPALSVAFLAALVLVAGGGILQWRQGVRDRRLQAISRRQARAEAVRRSCVSVARALKEARSLSGTDLIRNYSAYLLRIARPDEPATTAVVARALDEETAAVRRAIGGARDPIRADFAERKVVGPPDGYLRLLSDGLVASRRRRVTVPPLCRFLEATVDEGTAITVGEALNRIAGRGDDPRIRKVLREAAFRFGRGGEFYLQVTRVCPLQGIVPPDPSPPETPFPHPPQNEIPDRTGAILLDPLFVDSWLGRGVPEDALKAIPAGDDESDSRDSGTRRDVIALCQRAASRRARGDLEGAERDFAAALHLSPRRPDILVERGAIRRLAGKIGAAEADYTAALRLSPHCAQAFLHRAVARTEQRDFAGALADLAHADVNGADARFIHLYRAMTLDIAGRPEAAMPDAQATKVMNSAESRHVLATTRLLCGDVKGALAGEEEAVHLETGYSLGLNGLAVVRHLSGDDKGALEVCLAAIRSDPALPFPWVNRAVIELGQTNFRKAEAAASDAIARCPRLAPAWLARALARRSLGDHRGAARDAAEYVRLSPGGPRPAQVAEMLGHRDR